MTKVTLLGCGGWGKNVARNLASLGALERIVDPGPDAVATAAALGVDHASDPAAVIADPACKAIAIATPAPTHFELAMQAISAGKDVYVEKPIALSIEDGQRMGDAAKAAGRILMIGHILQYHPAFEELKRRVAAGEVGRVRQITTSRMGLGRLRNEENVLWSFAPHDLSMVCALTDAAPSRVRVMGNRFLSDSIEDVTTAHVEFADGMIAEIRSSWCHPLKDQSLIVVGDGGMAVFDDARPWPEKLLLSGYSVDAGHNPPRLVRGEERFIAVEEGEPLRREMQHFLDCIANRTNPRTDSEEALAVLRILQAAQRSLESDAEWVNV